MLAQVWICFWVFWDGQQVAPGQALWKTSGTLNANETLESVYAQLVHPALASMGMKFCPPKLRDPGFVY